METALGPRGQAAGLIHFESLRPGVLAPNLWGSAPDAGPDSRARAFLENLKPLGGGWCCVTPEGRTPGHYWYDFLFDLPHTDRFGRLWGVERPWRPTPGP